MAGSQASAASPTGMNSRLPHSSALNPPRSASCSALRIMPTLASTSSDITAGTTWVGGTNSARPATVSAAQPKPAKPRTMPAASDTAIAAISSGVAWRVAAGRPRHAAPAFSSIDCCIRAAGAAGPQRGDAPARPGPRAARQRRGGPRDHGPGTGSRGRRDQRPGGAVHRPARTVRRRWSRTAAVGGGGTASPARRRRRCAAAAPPACRLRRSAGRSAGPAGQSRRAPRSTARRPS